TGVHVDPSARRGTRRAGRVLGYAVSVQVADARYGKAELGSRGPVVVPDLGSTRPRAHHDFPRVEAWRERRARERIADDEVGPAIPVDVSDDRGPEPERLIGEPSHADRADVVHLRRRP